MISEDRYVKIRKSGERIGRDKEGNELIIGENSNKRKLYLIFTPSKNQEEPELKGYFSLIKTLDGFFVIESGNLNLLQANNEEMVCKEVFSDTDTIISYPSLLKLLEHHLVDKINEYSEKKERKIREIFKRTVESAKEIDELLCFPNSDSGADFI